MTRFTNRLAIATVGFGGYFGFAQQEAHTQLVVQLQLTNQVLTAENDRANAAAKDYIKGIETKITKNQNQPAELRILRICEDLRARTTALLDTMHAHRARLLRLTGNLPSAPRLRHPEATDLVTKNWGPGTLAQQSLAAQFARYAAALPAIAADSQKVAAPALAGQPIVSALASLAQTESDLLAAERQLLRYFQRQVGAPQLAKRIVAVATAESNTVQPGGTYRARFYLVKQLVLPASSVHMQCNSQPITVDSNGVGQVQFRVSTQPGPAVWTGSIRYKFNGRDSTFQVRVPYHIARR